MSDPNFPPDQRNAALSLWRRVRDFICELFNICGEPQQLAARHTLTFRDYKVMLPWIRAGEALLRRFLLIEAALLSQQAPSHGPPACPPKLQRRRAPSPAPLKRAPKPTQEDLENPASWRVSFHAISSSPARGGSGSRHSRETKGDVNARAQSCTSPSDGFAATSPASGGGANVAALSPKFRSALPLARRLEAILRVYNNPMPFVRRLAARIRKAVAFIARMLKDAWEKSRSIIPHNFHDDLGPCIAESQRLLTDSS